MKKRSSSLSTSTSEPPADLASRALRSGDSEIVLLSFSTKRRAMLTEAERDVALAIARGLSNAQIAAERGASVRTVANQVAALLKKLGVYSRVELVVQLGPEHFR